jgi:hypothetical protein
LPVGKKVVLQRSLVLTKAQAECRHPEQVSEDDGKIQPVQAHSQLRSKVISLGNVLRFCEVLASGHDFTRRGGLKNSFLRGFASGHDFSRAGKEL